MKQLIKKILSRILDKYKYKLMHSSEISQLKTNFLSMYNYCMVLSKREIDHTHDFSDERGRLLFDQLGTQSGEALYLINSLNISRTVHGSICEFGVAQGQTSKLIANELLQSSDKRDLILFDSFSGLPQPTDSDELVDDIYNLNDIKKYAGRMSYGEDVVIQKLSDIGFSPSRYSIKKGYVDPDFLEMNLPETISFAYIDFDFYEPIKITLEALSSRMPVGSIIMIDDFGYFSSGVEKAVYEFLNDKKANNELYDLEVPPQKIGHFALLYKK